MHDLRKAYNRSYYLGMIRVAIRLRTAWIRLRLAAFFLKMAVRCDNEFVSRYEEAIFEKRWKALVDWEGKYVRSQRD